MNSIKSQARLPTTSSKSARSMPILKSLAFISADTLNLLQKNPELSLELGSVILANSNNVTPKRMSISFPFRPRNNERKMMGPASTKVVECESASTHSELGSTILVKKAHLMLGNQCQGRHLPFIGLSSSSTSTSSRPPLPRLPSRHRRPCYHLKLRHLSNPPLFPSNPNHTHHTFPQSSNPTSSSSSTTTSNSSPFGRVVMGFGEVGHY